MPLSVLGRWCGVHKTTILRCVVGLAGALWLLVYHAHQCHVIKLLRRLAGEGIGVVADGQRTDVLNGETISRSFRVQARFSQDHMDGTPLLWFSV